jgi:TonB-linked SusC/RagA family outer membrane protein
MLPKQNYSRYSMRASLDQEIGKYVKIGFSSNTSYSLTNGANLGLYNTLSNTPISNPYNDDGTFKRTVKMSNDENYVYSRDVINNLGDKWKDQTRGFGTYNSIYGEVKVPGVDGLKYRINIGLNYRQNNYGSYTGEGVFSSTATTPSTATVSNSHTINWAIENMLTYDHTFAQKHKINAVALYSAEQTSYNSSYIAAQGISSDAFQYYNLGQSTGEITVNPSYQGYYQSGLMSWMGRVMYSYDDRYMISATVRSDASSRLAKGHQWHTYPAVSLGWNVTKESFMQDVKWLDNLKLRVGYGETSNQSVDPYKTLGKLATRPYNFGSTQTVGYYVSELPNPELGWEFSQTWNYGVDFSLFKGRLSGTVEYYVQKTKDLLLSVNLPSTSGVSSYMANVGKSENKGFELSLNGTILDNYHGWTWTAGLNLYSNHNKLTSLASGSQVDESNWWFVGHPINVIYDYGKVGIWSTDDYTNNYGSTLEPGGNAGMIKVKYTGDYDASGKPTRAIGAADRQIIKVDPDWEGGFNTNVSYKNFDLGIVGSFKHGGTLISTLYGSSGYLNMLTGRRNNVKVDYWTEDNQGAKFPKPGGIEDSNNPKYGNTLGYFSASYLKIRTITLGYNFKPEWLKHAGIQKLRMYCTVQNPFVFFSPYKDESGMDPETNSYGNENQAVNEVYKSRLLVVGTNSPNTRNYLFGLSVTF